MNRILAVALSVFLCAAGASAQSPSSVVADSLVFTPAASVDTTLRGKSIYSVMPSSVSVNQSSEIRRALSSRIDENGRKLVNGFRIRIYFDNGQNARQSSESALYRFKSIYPGIAAYRTFTSPYFKVTVGDFRTRSEAQAALRSIQRDFPAAFIVREQFRFPAMSGDSAYVVDTIKVHRVLR